MFEWCRLVTELAFSDNKNCAGMLFTWTNTREIDRMVIYD